MRPIRLVQTNAGNSAVAALDIHKHPFAVGIGVKVTGTPTYTVQHTFDDVLAKDFDPATATWFDHPTLKTLAANGDSNYAFPVRGIRLVVTGTGTVELTAIQAGL